MPAVETESRVVSPTPVSQPACAQFEVIRLNEKVAALVAELSSVKAKCASLQLENARLKLQISSNHRNAGVGRSRSGTAGSATGVSSSPAPEEKDARPSTPTAAVSEPSHIDDRSSVASASPGDPNSLFSFPRVSSTPASLSGVGASMSRERTGSAPALPDGEQQQASMPSGSFRFPTVNFNKLFGKAGDGASDTSRADQQSTTSSGQGDAGSASQRQRRGDAKPRSSTLGMELLADSDSTITEGSTSAETDGGGAEPGGAAGAATAAEAGAGSVGSSGDSDAGLVLVQSTGTASSSSSQEAVSGGGAHPRVAATSSVDSSSSATAAAPGSPATPSSASASASASMDIIGDRIASAFTSLFNKPKLNKQPSAGSAGTPAAAQASTSSLSSPPLSVLPSRSSQHSFTTGFGFSMTPSAGAAASAASAAGQGTAGTPALPSSGWSLPSWFNLRPKFNVNGDRLKVPSYARKRSNSMPNVLEGMGCVTAAGCDGGVVAAAVQKAMYTAEHCLDHREAACVASMCRLVAVDMGDAVKVTSHVRPAPSSSSASFSHPPALVITGSLGKYRVSQLKQALVEEDQPGSHYGAGCFVKHSGGKVVVGSSLSDTVVAVPRRGRDLATITRWLSAARDIEPAQASKHDPVAVLAKTRAAIAAGSTTPRYVAALRRQQHNLNRMPLPHDESSGLVPVTLKAPPPSMAQQPAAAPTAAATSGSSSSSTLSSPGNNSSSSSTSSSSNGDSTAYTEQRAAVGGAGALPASPVAQVPASTTVPASSKDLAIAAQASALESSLKQAIADLVRESGLFLDGHLYQLGSRHALCELIVHMLQRAEAVRVKDEATGSGGHGDIDVDYTTDRTDAGAGLESAQASNTATTAAETSAASSSSAGSRCTWSSSSIEAVIRMLIAASRTVTGGDTMRLVQETLITPHPQPGTVFLASEAGGPAEIIIDADGCSAHISSQNCFRVVQSGVCSPKAGSGVLAVVRCILNETMPLTSKTRVCCSTTPSIGAVPRSRAGSDGGDVIEMLLYRAAAISAAAFAKTSSTGAAISGGGGGGGDPRSRAGSSSSTSATTFANAASRSSTNPCDDSSNDCSTDSVGDRLVDLDIMITPGAGMQP